MQFDEFDPSEIEKSEIHALELDKEAELQMQRDGAGSRFTDEYKEFLGLNEPAPSRNTPLVVPAELLSQLYGTDKSKGMAQSEEEENASSKAPKKPENPLYELTRARRSIRRYGEGHIDDAIIREIMKVALTAPTSFGHKPVEYIVVRDKDMIRRIGACKQMGGSQINTADTVIVVMVKTEDKRQAEFWIEDGAIASAYILLAVEQYGLGACWVHIRNRMGQQRSSDEEIRALLGVPDGYTVLNLIAIGQKSETKPPYTDADLHTENVHYERYT